LICFLLTLPVLWPCVLSAPDLLQGPGGCTTLTCAISPPTRGPLAVHQLIVQVMLLGDTGMCCISPAPCCKRHASPRHPHKPLLCPHPGRHTAKEGGTTGVACAMAQVHHLAQVERVGRTAPEALGISHGSCCLRLYSSFLQLSCLHPSLSPPSLHLRFRSLCLAAYSLLCRKCAVWRTLARVSDHQA
jgi:hypothetical protein